MSCFKFKYFSYYQQFLFSWCVRHWPRPAGKAAAASGQSKGSFEISTLEYILVARFFFPDKKKVSKVCMYNDMAIRRKNSGWLRRKKRNFYFLTISFSLDFLMLQPALPILYHGELSAMNIKVFILLRSIIIMYIRIVRERVGKTFFLPAQTLGMDKKSRRNKCKKSHYFAFATNLLFLSPPRQYIACGARKKKTKEDTKVEKHFCSRWP